MFGWVVCYCDEEADFMAQLVGRSATICNFVERGFVTFLMTLVRRKNGMFEKHLKSRVGLSNKKGILSNFTDLLRGL